MLSAVLLAAGVAAAVAAGVARISADDAPHIASVRIAELAAEHAGRTAQADTSPEEAVAATRAWAAALEDALAEIAARGTVLLPARAIAAGAPDVTDLVRLMVEHSRKHAAAPARVSPARVSGGETRP